jgi:hypothetical protein
MPSKYVILIPAMIIGLLLLTLVIVRFDTLIQSRGVLLAGGLTGVVLGVLMLSYLFSLPAPGNESVSVHRSVLCGVGVVLGGGFTLLAAAARIEPLIILFGLLTALSAAASSYFGLIQAQPR